MSKPITPWTADRLAELTELWGRNYSASQVAAKMGGTTKNAVIGRVWRMKLTRSPNYVQIKRTASIKRKREREAGYRQQRREARPVIEVAIPRHVDLLDLTADACRWPYGDGPFTFCGCTALAGMSYCGTHYVASVGVGTASERSATKVSTSLLAVP